MTLEGKVKDIEIVYNLINAANSLCGEIKKSASDIINETSSFAEVWNDSQYEKFRDSTDKLAQQLSNNADIICNALKSLKDEIKED